MALTITFRVQDMNKRARSPIARKAISEWLGMLGSLRLSDHLDTASDNARVRRPRAIVGTLSANSLKMRMA